MLRPAQDGDFESFHVELLYYLARDSSSVETPVGSKSKSTVLSCRIMCVVLVRRATFDGDLRSHVCCDVMYTSFSMTSQCRCTQTLRFMRQDDAGADASEFANVV